MAVVTEVDTEVFVELDVDFFVEAGAHADAEGFVEVDNVVFEAEVVLRVPDRDQCSRVFLRISIKVGKSRIHLP